MFAFGEEDLQGNCSVGQLTTIGYAQQLKNGASLRKAYVDTGLLLSSKLSSQEVYIHSDGTSKIRSIQELNLIAYFIDAPRTRLVRM